VFAEACVGWLGGVWICLGCFWCEVTMGCIVGVHRPTFFACYITTTDAMHAQGTTGAFRRFNSILGLRGVLGRAGYRRDQPE
jgi:hypothetical protein